MIDFPLPFPEVSVPADWSNIPQDLSTMPPFGEHD